MTNLTQRESEIMELLADGWSYKQIHQHLGGEQATLRTHVANIKRKAGVSGPLHRLVVWYINATRLKQAA